MKEKKYNGHKNYDYWNVALWIGNDEGLYRHALGCIKACKSRKFAAALFLHTMHSGGTYQTPDGVEYTQENVHAALKGLES